MKFEIQNPEFEANSNFEEARPMPSIFGIRISVFEFALNLELRILNLADGLHLKPPNNIMSLWI